MEISGRVINGVVVLEGDRLPPEGATVRVLYPSELVIRVSPVQKRIEFPLIRSSDPCSVHLTNERIAEILEQEDVEAVKRSEDASS